MLLWIHGLSSCVTSRVGESYFHWTIGSHRLGGREVRFVVSGRDCFLFR